jgi:hypothetical protein
MKRFVLAGASALALLCGVATANADTKAISDQISPSPTHRTRDAEAALLEIQDAQQKLANGDFTGCYEVLKPVMAGKGLSQLEPALQRAAWYIFGVAATQNSNKMDEAHDAFRRSSVLEGAVGLDWYMRLMTASAREDKDDAVLAATTLAEDYPVTLSQVTDSGMAWLVASAKDVPRGDTRRFALLDALLAADWKPKSPYMDWSMQWSQHAAQLLDRGDATRAAEAAKRVTMPIPLIGMRADNRFAPVLKSSPGLFDIKAAYARRIERAQARVAADSTSLEAANQLVAALLSADRPAEGLKVVDDALAKALPADGATSSYKDVESVNLTLNLRAEVLFALRRDDEGLAVLARAARRPEKGRLNVSQTLNLAGQQMITGHLDEALETVAEVTTSDASAYGKMVQQSLRACIAAQKGDKDGVARLLEAMRKTQDDGPRMMMSALVCADDQDAAARLLIGRLADPDTRLEALSEVQNYPERSDLTAFEKVLRARGLAIETRPDVQAAIAAVGQRTERPPYPYRGW